MSNLEYPTAAYDNNIEGTVVVHFVIDTEGCLTDAHVVASPHSSLTREVLPGAPHVAAMGAGPDRKRRF